MMNMNMMNDMELARVAGGYLDVPPTESEAELANKMDDFFFDTIYYGYEIVKYALFG